MKNLKYLGAVLLSAASIILPISLLLFGLICWVNKHDIMLFGEYFINYTTVAKYSLISAVILGTLAFVLKGPLQEI